MLSNHKAKEMNKYIAVHMNTFMKSEADEGNMRKKIWDQKSHFGDH